MFFKKKGLEYELKLYSGVLIETSASSTRLLKQELNFTDSIAGALLLQVMGFELTILSKTFAQEDLSLESFKKCFNHITERLAKELCRDEDKFNTFLAHFRNDIVNIINTYSHLPLLNKNGKMTEGTLAWEYAKHMTKTIGKKDDDVVAIVSCLNVISNIMMVLNTNKIIIAIR